MGLDATLAVNVDVDALRFYRAIHGLDAAVAAVNDPTWTVGVPRMAALFESLDLRGTFFVVGSDLVPVSDGGAAPSANVADARRDLVRELHGKGHEIGSHSFGHDYALSKLSAESIAEDLRRARAVLEETIGAPVPGFRAPGYNLSAALIEAMGAAGISWSSSRLPSPPYFFAKWSVMALSALRGRRSASIMGELAAPFGRARPFRHEGGPWELPMSATGLLRLPAIGTFFTLYGERGVRWLRPALLGRDWLNIEFHAIDLVDAEDLPEDDELSGVQPDLATPVATKRALFEQWLAPLAEGHQNRTLGEVVESLEG